eukprot:2674880-Rhodomonas_salina.1
MMLQRRVLLRHTAPQPQPSEREHAERSGGGAGRQTKLQPPAAVLGRAVDVGFVGVRPSVARLS